MCVKIVAFTHESGAKCRYSTVDAHTTSPGVTVNVSWDAFAWPQGFSLCVSVCVCARAGSDLAPFHPHVAQIFKWGTSDLNGSLMRHGGV